MSLRVLGLSVALQISSWEWVKYVTQGLNLTLVVQGTGLSVNSSTTSQNLPWFAVGKKCGHPTHRHSKRCLKLFSHLSFSSSMNLLLSVSLSKHNHELNSKLRSHSTHYRWREIDKPRQELEHHFLANWSFWLISRLDCSKRANLISVSSQAVLASLKHFCLSSFSLALLCNSV